VHRKVELIAHDARLLDHVFHVDFCRHQFGLESLRLENFHTLRVNLVYFFAVILKTLIYCLVVALEQLAPPLQLTNVHVRVCDSLLQLSLDICLLLNDLLVAVDDKFGESAHLAPHISGLIFYDVIHAFDDCD